MLAKFNRCDLTIFSHFIAIPHVKDANGDALEVESIAEATHFFVFGMCDRERGFVAEYTTMEEAVMLASQLNSSGL